MELRLKRNIADLFQMQLWENPGKYLGLPADWGSSRSSALHWIRDIILTKIEGRKENLLNQAGKEILIKAVLQVVPSYAMSIIRFHKNFCKSICAAIARFWWRSKGRNRGTHWKSWADITRSKGEGGLGFKDFTDMNSSLLAKQDWRVIQNPQALWVRILQALYFPDTDFIRAKRKRNASWVWSSLLHGRDMVLSSARWTIGKGDKVHIYQDVWLASGNKVTFQEENNFHLVCDVIDPTTRSWDIQKIRRYFHPATAIQIVQTPIAW